jgi:hypothetical protein
VSFTTRRSATQYEAAEAAEKQSGEQWNRSLYGYADLYY